MNPCWCLAGSRKDLSSSVGRSVEFERVTQIARQLAYLSVSPSPLKFSPTKTDKLPRRLLSGYLSTDTVLWLQHVRFLRLNPKTLADTTTLSNRFWIAGIALSVASSLSGLVRVRREAKRAGLIAGEKNGLTQSLVAFVPFLSTPFLVC